ncbi:unnamed protein product [Mycena citricolor]|uniref:Uncharacterized protein n=1 Tax=Mycena citricolor TaxID=2018698 RepID=A0AAD2H1Y7_9AGAR|nr:unnamed protein product [Mycena citricolor]CAK5273411.1 unnamed protein product [Mycena citricolor]
MSASSSFQTATLSGVTSGASSLFSSTFSAPSATAPSIVSNPFSSPTSSAFGPGVSGGPGDGSPSNGGSGIQVSAKLYLYTFLATLILLLAVSAAIVARSLVLRRRHQRFVDEAIANGTLLPPAGRVRIDLKKKPRLHDAWLSPPIPSTLKARVSGSLAAGESLDWEEIRPFAASYIPPASSNSLPRATPAGLLRANSNFNAATSTGTTPNSAALGHFPPDLEATYDDLDPPKARVSVLLAMPTPDLFPVESTPSEQPTWLRPYAHADAVDDDDIPLPWLEMGISIVTVVPAGSISSDVGGKDSEGSGEGDST